jgi:hypothetical protein
MTDTDKKDYCDQTGNKGAIIKLNVDMVPNFITYTAVVRINHFHCLIYISRILTSLQWHIHLNSLVSFKLRDCASDGLLI